MNEHDTVPSIMWRVGGLCCLVNPRVCRRLLLPPEVLLDRLSAVGRFFRIRRRRFRLSLGSPVIAASELGRHHGSTAGSKPRRSRRLRDGN